jgi:hypothetical protein
MSTGINIRWKFSLYLLISLSSLSVYAMNELPDPTRPAHYIIEREPVFVEQVVTPGKKIAWTVSAIRISQKNRSAIVNGFGWEMLLIREQLKR